MKKALPIVILLLGILSCKDGSENGLAKSNPTADLTNDISKKKYSLRIFVEDSLNVRREFTGYISGEDTILTQVKLFKSNVLDTINSHFYDFELYKIADTTYSGKITLYSELDKLDSPYTNTLVLYFDGVEKKLEAKNQNFVEFELNSKSDTLMGLLIEYRSIDTTVNGKPMVRFVETQIPVDTKPETDNPFIEAFDIKGFSVEKNER
jgi:hypothetical protein